MPSEEVRLAVAIAEVKTELTSIATQLTTIVQTLANLEKDKASAKTQETHSKQIQDLELSNAQIKIIGTLAVILIPIIIEKILNSFFK